MYELETHEGFRPTPCKNFNIFAKIIENNS